MRYSTCPAACKFYVAKVIKILTATLFLELTDVNCSAGTHALCVGPVTASDGSQKLSRLAALCEASKQLQSRLQNETLRFRTDFANQGLNIFSNYVFYFSYCQVKPSLFHILSLLMLS